MPNTQVMKDVAGFFKPGQRRAIYNACDKWRNKLLIRLLWKTGRRVSEVISIRVIDIDFETKKILFNILKKGQKLRKWKYIDSKTLDLLGWYIAQTGLRPEHYVLNSGNPLKHITRKCAFEVVRKASKKAGIEMVGEKKPHPHHFRHTWAVEMAKRIKSPGDLRKLQMGLEHSSIGMTEVYLQFGDDDLSEFIDEDEDN